ncbi:MAG TPA: protein kinase [Aggregatilineales bacterium]|nr:protein kinase [Aggregatilineales bacterium]
MNELQATTQDLVHRFGQYEIRSILGMGGMGMVYGAYQPSLKREVAIKVLSNPATASADSAERFRREAEMAARLEHPHIVPVYDSGTTGVGVHYVVMRYLPGGSLNDRLEAHRKGEAPLPSLTEVSTLLRQMASALDYAHKRGVIHRDIKPNNIMFDEIGNAYLVDFGIAKALTDAATAGGSMTKTGAFVGTPPYMPPELWRGEDWSAASDQYALGIVLYEMLTGKLPFDAGTIYELINQHLTLAPRPPHYVREELPEALTPVIERSLNKDQSARYPSVGALADAFQTAITEANLTRSGAPSGFFALPALPPPSKLAPNTGLGLLVPDTVTQVDAPRITGYQPPPAPKRSLWPLLVGLLAVLVMGGLGVLAVNSGGEAQSLAATLTGFYQADPFSASNLTATATTCLALSGPNSAPAGQIAFLSDRTGLSKIYLMNADSTDLQQISGGESNEDYLVWSPSGLRLAYTATESGTSDLYVLSSTLDDPTTFGMMRLTENNFQDTTPAWSPDGRNLVYSSNLNGNWDIFVIDALVPGSEPTALISHPAEDINPVWSPDGTQIAFASNRDGNQDIYLVPVAGGVPRQVTDMLSDEGNLIAWSPDGRYLTFTSEQSSRDWDLYAIDTEAENALINLTNTPDVSEWFPIWSPDSLQLGYLSNQRDEADVVVQSITNGGRHSITARLESAPEYAYDWSADSRYLVYQSGSTDTADLYLTDVCGSLIEQLTDDPGYDSSPAWRPALGG